MQSVMKTDDRMDHLSSVFRTPRNGDRQDLVDHGNVIIKAKANAIAKFPAIEVARGTVIGR